MAGTLLSRIPEMNLECPRWQRISVRASRCQGAQRGVPRSGLWSENGVSPLSGVRSGERNRQRAGAGRERSGEESPREHLAQEGIHG